MFEKTFVYIIKYNQLNISAFTQRKNRRKNK